jgi:tetraacyldisaccharide 4'-kinase
MRAPEFWTRDDALARCWGTLLSPLGAAYGCVGRSRRKRARPYRAKARILCIGNLTAGGTGKTPVAIALARMLAAREKKVVFLSRGHGGRLRGALAVDLSHHSAADVGDEPLLLAAHATAIVARDRSEGARLADALGADVVVMDDGFQNFQLAKDVSILVADAQTGFGNGRLIPAGPLREGVGEGLARADALMLMGEGGFTPSFDGPVLHAHLTPCAPHALQGRSVFAFAGIGRPEKFFAMLTAMGARVVAAESFPDHHRFAARELAEMKAAAAGANLLLVTTEKDFVRIAPAARKDILPVPVQARIAEPDLLALAPLLDRLCEARKDRPS